MVKNHSRKIKKRGASKYHLGGRYGSHHNGTDVIPKGTVHKLRPIFGEDSEPSSVSVKQNPGKKEEAVDHIPTSTDVVESKPTESSELQFQFTRHVMSCNNIEEGKYYTKGKDFEPGATAYGIEKTIEYAHLPEQNKYFNFDHVYVSNLYRTWITAVLLYGTKLQSTPLNLYISPYLKEYHKTILGQPVKRGNFPKEINHMANKFLKFLNTLKTLHDNQGKRNIIPVSRETNPIPEGDEEEEEETRGGSNRRYSLPNNIILHLPPRENSNETQKITYQKGDQEYKVQSFCNIQDTAGPNSGDEFIETGNLKDFMEWYNSNSNYYRKNNDEDNENNKVHIVTHSHIMREYLMTFNVKTRGGDDSDAIKRAFLSAMTAEKNIYDKTPIFKRPVTDFKHLYRLQEIFNKSSLPKIEFDLDLLQYYLYNKIEPIYPIRNSNCWHFITTVNKELTDKSVNEAIKEFDIHKGVPIKKKMAKDMEDKTPNSLCGKEGSVEVMGEMCPVGGRKTRKRRIRRTKKNSKRKNNKSRKHHK